jgi:hypothetical protein
MGFQVFEKGSAPVSSVPAATIQKRGLISLNRTAFELLHSPEAVELMWDPDERLIGFRSAPLSNPNAYPVRAQNASSSKGPVLIAGSLFTRFIGLDTSEAKRWVPTLNDDILVIDLNTPGQKVTSNRSRAGATSSDED